MGGFGIGIMTKIRVARIITRLNVGGPAYQAALLNHLLAERGYETLLIHGSVPAGEVQFERLLETYPGPTVYCPALSRSVGLKDVKAFFQILRILRDFRPDIVHTHTAKAGLLGRIAAKLAGVKIIVHTYHGHVLEGYFSRPVSQAIIVIERLLARLTSRLVTISSRLTHQLVEQYHIAAADKFATIELGLPLEWFLHLPPRGSLRKEFHIPDDAIVLGSLGRLVPIKNFHRMLDVVAGVIGAMPQKPIHLIIGGTGPLEADLKRYAVRNKIENQVHFAGLVNNLPQFYADIDLAILTSDNEGTPVTLLEAQAAGKYVVAADVGGIGDIIDPQAGILIRPNEARAYVQSLRHVLSNLPAVPESVRAGIVERFSPHRLVENIDDLYKNLLQESGVSAQNR